MTGMYWACGSLIRSDYAAVDLAAHRSTPGMIRMSIVATLSFVTLVNIVTPSA
ncbi:hypothetical protein YSY43_44820 [Paenibacillus sp. YSY-4.3]